MVPVGLDPSNQMLTPNARLLGERKTWGATGGAQLEACTEEVVYELPCPSSFPQRQVFTWALEHRLSS